jgi:hypothetical protein
MQTEDQKAVEKKPEPPKKPERPKVSRKDELLAKKAHAERKHSKLTKAEQKELDEILEQEKLERERGAIIHKLSEAATKYERKEGGKIRREVTDRVKVFSKDEDRELGEVRTAIKAERKAAKKAVDDAVQALQSDLKKAMTALDAKEHQEVTEVQAKYRTQYDDASSQIEHDIRNVEATVRYFKDELQHLTLDQLRTLQKDGVVEVGKVKGNPDYLVAPGTEQS